MRCGETPATQPMYNEPRGPWEGRMRGASRAEFPPREVPRRVRFLNGLFVVVEVLAVVAAVVWHVGRVFPLSAGAPCVELCQRVASAGEGCFLAVLVVPAAWLLLVGVGRACLDRGSQDVLLRRAKLSRRILVLALGLGALSEPHRYAELRAMAIRADPLVAAIRVYDRDHGRPPGTLQSLVPGYLRKVPTPGLRRCPEFEYIPAEFEMFGIPHGWELLLRLGTDDSDCTCFAIAGARQGSGMRIHGWVYEPD